MSGNLISKGGSPLLNAALKGTGVLLLSDWMTREYIENGSLTSVLPQWKVTHGEYGSGEIFAIYKSTQYPKPYIRAFLDFVIDKMENSE